MKRTEIGSRLLAFFLTFLVFVLISAYDHARTWTNQLEGITNGLIHTLFFSIAYFVFVAPIICLLVLVTRNRPKSCWWRSVVCFAPVLLLVIGSVSNWIANPATDMNCFSATMGFEMPSTATQILSERYGGGITDISDRYYFRADSREIKQMIKLKPFVRRQLVFPFVLPQPIRIPKWKHQKNAGISLLSVAKQANTSGCFVTE